MGKYSIGHMGARSTLAQPTKQKITHIHTSSHSYLCKWYEQWEKRMGREQWKKVRLWKMSTWRKWKAVEKNWWTEEKKSHLVSVDWCKKMCCAKYMETNQYHYHCTGAVWDIHFMRFPTSKSKHFLLFFSVYISSQRNFAFSYFILHWDLVRSLSFHKYVCSIGKLFFVYSESKWIRVWMCVSAWKKSFGDSSEMEKANRSFWEKTTKEIFRWEKRHSTTQEEEEEDIHQDEDNSWTHFIHNISLCSILFKKNDRPDLISRWILSASSFFHIFFCRSSDFHFVFGIHVV